MGYDLGREVLVSRVGGGGGGGGGGCLGGGLVRHNTM